MNPGDLDIEALKKIGAIGSLVGSAKDLADRMTNITDNDQPIVLGHRRECARDYIKLIDELIKLRS